MASIASAAWCDVEKFDGQNDFGLWKMKMRALLGNLGLEEALEAEKPMPETLIEVQKNEIRDKRKETNKRAFNTLI